MQEAFGIVLFCVVIAAAFVAVGTFATSNSTYDQIGRGGLYDGTDRPASEPTGAAAAAEAEAEVRQMLEARNLRRVRRGEEPLDVDAEVRALMAPKLDDELVLEVRALVEARNARRIRRGEPPLDVEDEVARRLQELQDEL